MTDKLSERTPQTKLDALKALPDDELLEKAWAEISALCGSNKGPQKRWTMSVPVNAERDSDVLFGEVLRRYAALEQRVEGWRRTVDSYVNGDGTKRDLECALENGPLTDEELREDYPEALKEETT